MLFYKFKNKILDAFSEVESKQKMKYGDFIQKRWFFYLYNKSYKDKIETMLFYNQERFVPVDSVVKDYGLIGHWTLYVRNNN